ncbi:hypothetical protein M9H77_21225 [Catharanthus roseus]|uniref:Uncharacterized protein n=1 Tax=Catharanthus roseus TaxID=4058 RepID=A0ACC0ALP3_CATRO|nr:hypothetical protein M9H77_21225 [Catharanthus roseus]
MEPETGDHIEEDYKEEERRSRIGRIAGCSAEQEEENTSSRIANIDLERAAGTSDENIIDDCVLDVDSGEINGGDCVEEQICRICHLNDEAASSPGVGGLMQLGCNCRGELGLSHPYCAETWFKHRGNSLCEICGIRAKNVKFVKNYNSRMFIVDFDDIRPITTTRYPSMEEGSRRCKQSCCNFLLACLVLGLVVPWFFRTNLF